MAQDGWDYLGFILVMLGVAAPFLMAVLVKHYFSYRSDVTRQLNEMNLEIAKLGGAALAEQVEKLQARVETLEAVVTDRPYQLDQQIRAL